MKRQLTDQLMTLFVILASVFIMAVIFIHFRSRMDAEINNTTASYLSGNVDALATAFQTKLEDQLIMLESQTRYFTGVDLTDYNAMKETIMATKGMEAFTSIGVASSAGSTMNYEGKSSGNILLRDYFQEAMKGFNAISAEPAVDEFGNEVLVLAVPIRQAGSAKGVIYGTFTQSALSNLLKNVQFGEESASVLVTGSGTILARTTDTDLLDDEVDHIQDAIPGLNISSGTENIFYTYTSGDQTNILVLRPIGFHDWYFGMIVSRDIVSRQRDTISRYVIIFILEMTAIVSALLLYIYLAMRHNRHVQSQLKKKAQTDPLTGILNKAAFGEAVNEAVNPSSGTGCGALFIIDLDDFKTVNDSLGHATGDKVLTDTADKLRQIFRDQDLAGRIGGDEFAAYMVCSGDIADMHSLIHGKAERLIEELTQVYRVNGETVEVSASVGMAICPDHGTDYTTLYENADKALYTAKRGGKKRYESYL